MQGRGRRLGRSRVVCFPESCPAWPFAMPSARAKGRAKRQGGVGPDWGRFLLVPSRGSQCNRRRTYSGGRARAGKARAGRGRVGVGRSERPGLVSVSPSIKRALYRECRESAAKGASGDIRGRLYRRPYRGPYRGGWGRGGGWPDESPCRSAGESPQIRPQEGHFRALQVFFRNLPMNRRRIWG